MTFRVGSTPRQYLIVLLVCWWAFAFRFARPNFHNDHFDHLSKARQVLFGELPTRDFFDDGRPLTIYASALVQRLSPTLLSEAILTTAAIAGGVGFVYVLARSLSGSTFLGLVAALLTMGMQSRLYSYPKAFLFPWAIWLLWRYVDRPTRWRLAQLALLTVVAFLFRYDYGVYVAAVYVATLAAFHGARAVPALASYVAAGIVITTPYLIWLGTQGLLLSTGSSGFTDMVRSIPGITRAPVHLDFSQGLFDLAPRPPQLGIRWRADVDAETRRAVEVRYGLHERSQKADGRSVLYFMDDPTPDRIRTLLDDRHIEDTSGVDRGDAHLLPSSSWDRWQNAIPLLRLTPAPIFRTREDAQGWLYYVFVLSVPLAILVLWLFPDRSVPHRAIKVMSLALMCLLLQQLLIQGSLDSRLPDVVGPTAVLLIWLARRSFDAARRLPGPWWSWIGPPAVVLTLSLLALLTWDGAAAYAGTSSIDLLTAGGTRPGVFSDVARRLGGRPIDYWTSNDSVGVPAMIRYVGRCLSPEDRLLVVSYAPDVFYFSERLFAGGMNKFDASVFSSSKEQALAIARLQRQSVPLVIVGDEYSEKFKHDWPDLARYVESRYREVAVLGFGASRRAFHVLVDPERVPLTTDPLWSLPCFQSAS